MQVAVRVDASARIGTGHVVRCLALARALAARGARVHFVSRELTAGARAQIESRNFELTLVDGSRQGVADALMALSGTEWDWLVVDHYDLDAQWESSARAAARRILVIDDLADRPHDCDLLLDQNLLPEMHTRYGGYVPQAARRLLGPDYVLLRPEFRELRLQTRPRSGPVKRVLLLFGGTDPCDLTGRALAAIGELTEHRVEVDVVIGADHPNRKDLEGRCATLDARCHVQSEIVAQLMQGADLAIGAGGSSSWERCCLGLPAICIPFVENQRPIARALHEFGACLYLGDEPSVDVHEIASAVKKMISDGARRQRMSELAYSLVDGEGAARVCQAMSEPT